MVPPLVVVIPTTLRPPNTFPTFTGCEQSVLNCTFSISVLLASKILMTVSALRVLLPALAALTDTTSPSGTLAVAVSSHTRLPAASVARIRTGEALGVLTNCVHLILSAPCVLLMAAHPPPSYWSCSTLMCPRQLGGAGGAGSPLSH